MGIKSIGGQRKGGAVEAKLPHLRTTGVPAYGGCLAHGRRPSSNEPEVAQEQPMVRVLLCEDDHVYAMLIRTWLQRIIDREIVLFEAANRDETQNTLDKRSIDVVLMRDGTLRKWGTDWCANLAAKRLTLLVMLTQHGGEQITTEAAQSGIAVCLPESDVSPQTLCDAFDAALGKRKWQHAMADQEGLDKVAACDVLTRLHDRGAVLVRLRELISLANRYKDDLSLIMVDLDRITAIDDRHSQLAGEEVLKEIGTLIRRNVRDSDIVGWWAADQFVIVMPRTGLSSACVAAERLRSLIEESEMKDSQGRAFHMTVSLGLAGWERGEDAHTLICRAEEALHRAKERGGNRVQVVLGPSLKDKT